MSENIHISEVPEFIEDPTALAFTSYVLMNSYGLPMSLAQVTPCDIPFGKGKVKYRIYLESAEGITMEFFIVTIDSNLGLMAQRLWQGDTLLEDHIGLTHYQHRSINVAGVLEIFKNIPKQPPVDYAMPCSCSQTDR